MITSQLAARRRNIKLLSRGILLVAGIALASAYGWSSWQLRRLQLANVEVSTTNLAQALADQASSVFKTADTVLVGMVDRIEHDGLHASSKAALHPMMMAHMAQLPALQGCSSMTRPATGSRIQRAAPSMDATMPTVPISSITSARGTGACTSARPSSVAPAAPG